MEENSEKVSQIVKSETNDVFQSLYEIKESKKEVKFEEIDKDKVIIEEDNDTPNHTSRLVDQNGILIYDDKVNIVADVKYILSSAVSSVSKCQQMLSSADDISEKTFDSIIERLKIIKFDLSNIQADLVKIQPLKYEDELISVEDLVKREPAHFDDDLHDDAFGSADHEIQRQDETDIKEENGIKERLQEIQNGFYERSRGTSLKKFCGVCDESFDTEKELQVHKRLCVFVDSSDCDICGKSFSKASQLKKHISLKHPLEITPTMHKSPSYKCDICNLNFDKKKELKEHMKALNHESDLDKMICEYCNKTLSSERKYNQHILKFHAKGHTCKLCNQAFDDKKELKTHLKTTHETSNPRCITCFQEFTSLDSLKVHMEEHGLLSCTLCNKKFQTEKSLNTHNKNQHSQRFKCKDCDKAYDTKVQLKRHRASVHEPPKKKVCPTCGHTTHSPGAYWRHVQIHGQKIHKCEVCGKAFPIKRSLTTHYRIHTGEKPYVCQECGATFRKNSGLARHRFVHSGEKTHVCFLCNKGFNQSGNLKTHMKSHLSGNIPTV